MDRLVFASIEAEAFMARLVKANPDVQALVDGRVFPGLVLPPGEVLPAILYYRETALDQNVTMAGEISKETFRYVWRVIIEGLDYDPIIPAAKAMHRALQGAKGREGAVYLHCERFSELTFDPRSYENDESFVQLGGVYTIDAT